MLMLASSDKFITIDGIKLRYVSRGSGEPVVLVHGFGEFLEIWSYNLDEFSANYRVYALDLPGHGKSEAPPPAKPLTLSYTAQLLARFMESLNLDRVNLMAHSLGALVSLKLALIKPELVNKLVLVDAAGFNQSLPLHYRLATLPWLGEFLFRPTFRFVHRIGLKRGFYNTDIITEEWIDLSYRYLKARGAKDALLSTLRCNSSLKGLLPESSVSNKLQQITAPTLVVHGAQDRVIPLDVASRVYQAIPGAILQVFRDCGHCPHIEKAEEFNRAAIAFFNGFSRKGEKSQANL